MRILPDETQELDKSPEFSYSSPHQTPACTPPAQGSLEDLPEVSSHGKCTRWGHSLYLAPDRDTDRSSGNSVAARQRSNGHTKEKRENTCISSGEAGIPLSHTHLLNPPKDPATMESAHGSFRLAERGKGSLASSTGDIVTPHLTASWLRGAEIVCVKKRDTRVCKHTR